MLLPNTSCYVAIDGYFVVSEKICFFLIDDTIVYSHKWGPIQINYDCRYKNYLIIHILLIQFHYWLLRNFFNLNTRFKVEIQFIGKSILCKKHLETYLWLNLIYQVNVVVTTFQPF